MNVGFLGTGLLGAPMAECLLGSGLRLAVYNRTRAKAERLVAAGARLAPTPREAVAFGECVILMLADAPAIREVLLDSPAREALAGRTVVQMGTIRPVESLEIRERVFEAGGDYLEAPVLGSIPQARERKLIVMVGGSEDQFRKWRELLSRFGPDPRHIGPVGAAAAMKLALNHLIASLTTAFSLSLGLVLRSGLSVDEFLSILRGSALFAPTFEKKLPGMLERRFDDPNFPLKHLAKDVDLVLAEANALGLETAALAGVRAVIRKGMTAGAADLDYSALYEAVNPPRSGGA
jgi:3-hydroxyisobutyrate dehydrogenase